MFGLGLRPDYSEGRSPGLRADHERNLQAWVVCMQEKKAPCRVQPLRPWALGPITDDEYQRCLQLKKAVPELVCSRESEGELRAELVRLTNLLKYNLEQLSEAQSALRQREAQGQAAWERDRQAVIEQSRQTQSHFERLERTVATLTSDNRMLQQENFQLKQRLQNSGDARWW